jgi:uracil-DNA glycosylase
MLKLLIVGDKPSSKNTDPAIAFVGTKSFRTIQSWLREILEEEEAEIVMINRVAPDFSKVLVKASLERYKIIALGVEASQALVNHGVARYFRLPHPSGRNRKLNNKQYLAEVLAECKKWLKED